MNVHLVRSVEYAPEKFWQVIDLLENFPGVLRFFHCEQPVVMEDEFIARVPVDPVQIIVQKDSPVNHSSPGWGGISSLPENELVVEWKNLFGSCRDYRKEHDLGDEEFVVLLTELSNTHNWFAAADPSGGRNIFVHTAFWDFFSGSDQRYPVAYHVVTVILKQLMFRSYSDLNDHWHIKPKGCIMDFCRNKNDISLKLRTGDICPACLGLLEERKVDHNLIRQVFAIMEGIRAQVIFKERFIIQRRTPELVIEGWKKKFIFPDLGNLEISLTPLEKATYLLFLSHPEGILLNSVQDHRSVLLKWYQGLSNTDDLGTMQARVNDLADPLSNSMSEKISRIRRKFVEALGEEMASDFLIHGASGEPRHIPVARTGSVRFGG